MAGKQDLPPDVSGERTPIGARGTWLDRDRTASMADEGGTSGAYMEMEAPFPRANGSRGKPRWLSLLGWGVLAASATVAGGLLLRAKLGAARPLVRERHRAADLDSETETGQGRRAQPRPARKRKSGTTTRRRASKRPPLQ